MATEKTTNVLTGTIPQTDRRLRDPDLANRIRSFRRVTVIEDNQMNCTYRDQDPAEDAVILDMPDLADIRAAIAPHGSHSQHSAGYDIYTIAEPNAFLVTITDPNDFVMPANCDGCNRAAGAWILTLHPESEHNARVSEKAETLASQIDALVSSGTRAADKLLTVNVVDPEGLDMLRLAGVESLLANAESEAAQALKSLADLRASR